MAPPVASRPGPHTASVSRHLMESRATFAELYCQKRNLAANRFVEAVLAESLYPHAHMFFVFLVWLHPDYAASDIDFIGGVGRLTRLQDFWAEAEDFAHHPRNRGFLRQRLRVRVSARRLRRLIKETIGVTTTEALWPSAVPWPSGNPEPIREVDAGAP
jgi:hypothetical protein